jgi:ADP-ribose pyrophosphatase
MQITGERVLQRQKWTLLKEKSYRDAGGREGSWSYIERIDNRRAAVVVPLTEASGSLVIIEQFRIPFAADIYEFPAGLIDPGETPAQTAERELREETGYEGEVLEVGPGVCTTAGLSTEIVHMVYMRVGERPAVEPRPEGSERIRVITLAADEFAPFLSTCEREGRIIDSKLYTYLRERARRRV